MAGRVKIWLCILACALALASPPQVAASSYTIVVLPDTQNYTDTAAYNHQFFAQTQWIIDNRAA